MGLKLRSHTRIGIFFLNNWSTLVVLHHTTSISIGIGNVLYIGDYLPSPAFVCSSHSHGEIFGVLAAMAFQVRIWLQDYPFVAELCIVWTWFCEVRIEVDFSDRRLPGFSSVVYSGLKLTFTLYYYLVILSESL